MKITRIEQIAYELDGKRFIEGRIKRDIQEARDENNQSDNWTLNEYPEMNNMILERLF